jgi:hypothetical protein
MSITATESKNLFEALKGCSNENAVKEILDSHPFTSNPDQNWIPLGNNHGNAAMTQNTSGSLGAFIAELATNAIDANIIRMKNDAERNGVVFPEETLKSPEQILKFMHPESFENLNALQDFTKKIMGLVTTEYKLEDEKKTRTKNVTVFDKGCGQNAYNFKNTFCSVGMGEDNKANSPYLHGNYGQGSTAANAFSGEEGYKLIASRENESDKWAWTIIRKNPKKPAKLEYLVVDSNHTVPEFEAQSLELAYYCSTGKVATGKAHIEYGSMIKVYSVNMKKGYTEIKKFVGLALMRPVLPISSLEFSYSKEGEDEKESSDHRWINGFGELIDRLVYENKAVVSNFEINVPKLEGVVYGSAYFFEKEEDKKEFEKWLPSENKNNRVFHINNGQVQNIDNMTLVGDKYASLKEHVIIELDLSYVNQDAAYGRLFKSDRLTFQKQTAAYAEYYEKLIEKIHSWEVIEEWNRKVVANKVAFASSGYHDNKGLSCMTYLEKALNFNTKNKAYQMMFIQEMQDEKALEKTFASEFQSKDKKAKKDDNVIEVESEIKPVSFREVKGELKLNKKSPKAKITVKFDIDARKNSLIGKNAKGGMKVKKITLNGVSSNLYNEECAILELAEDKNHHVVCDINLVGKLKDDLKEGDNVLVETLMTTVDEKTGEVNHFTRMVAIKIVMQEVENKDGKKSKGKKEKEMSPGNLFKLDIATLDGKMIDNKETGLLPSEFDKDLGWNVLYDGNGFLIQVNIDNPELSYYMIESKYIDYREWIVGKLYNSVGVHILAAYTVWQKELPDASLASFQDYANERSYCLKTFQAVIYEIHIGLKELIDEKKKDKEK